MPRLRRPLTLLAVLLAGSGVTACGKHPDENARILRAETEGLYLDIDELKYQVQGSRQLNPNDLQDKPLLTAVPPAERDLHSDEVWFGVFLRVQNVTEEALRPSADIEILDTQEDVFKPLALGESNVFAYRSNKAIPAGETLPLLDTPAFDTPLQGSLLLFKLTLDALDNRPLELKIEGVHAPQQTGIIDLDV